MKEVTLVYPNQLFIKNPALARDRDVVLLEDPTFFYDKIGGIKHHKIKCVLHRASMKQYYDKLVDSGFTVKYIEYSELDTVENVYQYLKESGYRIAHITNVVNHSLERRIRKYSRKYNLFVTWHETPNFLTSTEKLKEYFESQKHHYFHKNFYKWQRKRLDILVDKDGNPEGGKWSFDTENREAIPEGTHVPEIKAFGKNRYVSEAINYVQKQFPENWGYANIKVTESIGPTTKSLAEPDTSYFYLPTNQEEAEAWLDDFLENRFKFFGVYEDAIQMSGVGLFHSMLSPILNIGLLDPRSVIQKTIAYAHKHGIPMNSLEGYIRQVIGWREFMRAVYVLEGEKLRKQNYFSHKKRLKKKWFTGRLAIEPIDSVIKKAQIFGYAHHIERLMLMGNFFLLSEIHPNDVYKWFMEMMVDAYDWVMVPNVYGMSQYADGGSMVTKPYISSSNYVIKMSDYKKKSDTKKVSWDETWDGLYWHFIDKHHVKFEKNSRMRLMVNVFDKKKPAEKKKLKHDAEVFLARI